ncbi:tyrosine-protein phosphatase DSP3-like [Solanum stenotomum]|uniref:tyrosine-protein phosphatase DSP3-like n=1 Tax=Solanum stenotomum TaxID=172797 RepID=UPI0020D106BA|nr:tyrosine-protein phosphatase DSP3-like [Solanum stenotomum]
MSMIVDLKEEGDDDLLVQLPPTNFSAVENNYIYRSGFPHPSNFTFLRSLSLRSNHILMHNTSPPIRKHRINNIKLYQFSIDGTKDASTMSSRSEIIMDGLRVITDERNHPVLVHCKRGKHRTGCVVGCLRRKLQNWCLDVVVEEEFKPKWRETDLKILESFDVQILFEYFKYLL